jgi:hypothetical protein
MFQATVKKYADLHTIRFSKQQRTKRRNLSEFEWPSLEIRGVWHQQKFMLEDLHLKTIEHSKSDGEFNFVLSNGERTDSES